MEVELKLSKKDSKEILFERVHRIRKSNSNDLKPKPPIAKFTFQKDKAFVLAQAKNLRGTNFTVACDFPKEIVEKREIVVPLLEDAKRSGYDSSLVYGKLYINGQLYRP